jgi:transcription elongation factor GreA
MALFFIYDFIFEGFFMSDVVYMTKESVIELEEEIFKLKTKGRKEIAQKIAEARSHGDLSENSEYDAAKNEQGLLELRISKMEMTLSKVEVIKSDELPNDKVYILSRVKLKNLKNNTDIEYLLVSAEEADFEKRKLSVTSPLGKALMGKLKGDIVELVVPAGKTNYEILDISR